MYSDQSFSKGGGEIWILLRENVFFDQKMELEMLILVREKIKIVAALRGPSQGVPGNPTFPHCKSVGSDEDMSIVSHFGSFFGWK